MSKVIFYAAHQDDDILIFGPSIINHLKSGCEVMVVMVTDGTADGSLPILNGECECYWHKYIHNPKSEGYGFLTKTEFSAARDREFRASMLAIGVLPNNIILTPCEMRVEDGRLSVNQAKAIIMYYANLYPGAKHKTLSFMDVHSDHKALGVALDELFLEGKVIDACFYVKSGQRSELPGFKEPFPSSYKDIYFKGLDEYKLWDPCKGRFAIGYHSSFDSFARLEANTYSQIHRSSSELKISKQSF